MEFEDDPGHPGKVTHDAGGRTRFGIAEKFHSDLPEQFFTGPADEALKLAKAIMESQYWEPLKLAKIASQDVANKIFDMAVNMGTHQAAVLVQRSVNFLIRNGAQALINAPIDLVPNPPAFMLAEDGIMGPKTIAGVNQFKPAAMIRALREFSENLYRHIATNNPEQAGNLEGWLKRAAA